MQSRFVSVDPVPDGWERSMRAEVEENRLTRTLVERVGEAWFAYTRCGAVLCVHKAPEVEPCGKRLRGPYSDFLDDWLTPPRRAAVTGPHLTGFISRTPPGTIVHMMWYISSYTIRNI